MYFKKYLNLDIIMIKDIHLRYLQKLYEPITIMQKYSLRF